MLSIQIGVAAKCVSLTSNMPLLSIHDCFLSNPLCHPSRHTTPATAPPISLPQYYSCCPTSPSSLHTYPHPYSHSNIPTTTLHLQTCNSSHSSPDPGSPVHRAQDTLTWSTCVHFPGPHSPSQSNITFI